MLVAPRRRPPRASTFSRSTRETRRSIARDAILKRRARPDRVLLRRPRRRRARAAGLRDPSQPAGDGRLPGGTAGRRAAGRRGRACPDPAAPAEARPRPRRPRARPGPRHPRGSTPGSSSPGARGRCSPPRSPAGRGSPSITTCSQARCSRQPASRRGAQRASRPPRRRSPTSSERTRWCCIPASTSTRFTPSPLPPGPPHALVLGALVGWKRPELALEIAALMPELRLTLAGATAAGRRR